MITHYQSSKGPVKIATMPLRYARNALDKLMREGTGGDREDEIIALGEHVEKLTKEHEASDDGKPARTVGDIINELPPVASQEIGANNPPEATPFEQSREEIEALYRQAKDLLDGQPIDNELAAMEVGTLRNEIRAAAKRADERRVTEAKPFDDGKADVQARYNPLIQKGKGKTELALAACNDALAPYLKKKDDDLRVEAERQRAEAHQIALAARAAAQEAARTGDLSARETAESLLADAKGALSDTKKAEGAKAQIGGVGGRAIGMRTVYEPDLTDPAAAIEHYRKAQPAALKVWMLDQAAKDIRAGSKPPAAIPGFNIISRQVPA
jgi:hypothetical protein